MVIHRLQHGLAVVRAFQVQLQNVEIIAVGMQGGDVQARPLAAVILVIIVGADVRNPVLAKQLRQSRVIVVLPAALSPTMPNTIGLRFVITPPRGGYFARPIVTPSRSASEPPWKTRL